MRSPSELVEHSVDLGASPRAIICWGRLAKVWALLVRRRTEVYPEDIQDLAPHVLRHRIWLGPHAASHGLTTRGGHQGRHRAGRDPMRSREQTDDPLVNLSDLSEIELLILKRMREFTIGDHRSVFHGTGFDFVGLRDWQPGDRLASIDWPQSTITNFSPLVVRDFEQPSTAGVMAVADVSPSTRCGIDGVPIAAAIARAIGTIGISAVFFQDTFGLITFDAGFKHLAAVRPRIGKNQVIHCLDAYQHQRGLQDVKEADSLSTRIAGVHPQAVAHPGDLRFSVRRCARR